MIEVQALRKQFHQGRGRWSRAVQAVDGVSFSAADGAITGLLGPNGAGKTTSLRMISGLMAPDSGRAVVDGIDVQREPAQALSRLGVLSDARGLYTRLTARENIRYFARLQGLEEAQCEQRIESLAEALDMRALLDRRTDGFSQGERMKTALARALIHDPPNIILDEPTNGLDVLATRALREVLRRLRDEHHKCVVFSTHIMQEVERLCDQVIVVAQGRTVAEGTVAELSRRAGQADFEEAFVRLAFGATSGQGVAG
ncbi:MAG: ATP-binding cassette domain-containing protein [Rubrivivax sp.]|nr:ATP-binding cassette domain-containing protein [Rubrivivax sp.]